MSCVTNKEPVRLGEQALSLMQVARVAQDDAPVTLSPAAQQRVADCHAVVMQAMRNNQPVYGLTVGVGWNKDRSVFLTDESDPGAEQALLEHSRAHNHASLRAHAAGIGEPLSVPITRAAMLVRLNMMLTGASGAQPAVVEQLAAFLNHGITPLLPANGSLGMADLTQSAHIGLSLVGEWDVQVNGQTMSAQAAIAQAGLPDLRLIGKDFLALASTNCITAGWLCLSVLAVTELLQRVELLAALAMEGMNANLSPLLDTVTAARPETHMQACAAALRSHLQGSSLWQPDAQRPLQDPLSFRNIAYVLGQLHKACQGAHEALAMHINSSDDNPLVSLQAESCASEVANSYCVRNAQGELLGAIYPSANFDGTSLVCAAQDVALALARLSQTLTMQVVRTESPALTGLTRYLAHPLNAHGHAFGALQKPMISLDQENQSLGKPVSLGNAVLGGNIEDLASHGMLATANIERMLDNLYQMASLHLLHFAQAVDLRLLANPQWRLSSHTKDLLDAYREHVALVTQDRIFTADIAAGARFFRQWQPGLAASKVSA